MASSENMKNQTDIVIPVISKCDGFLDQQPQSHTDTDLIVVSVDDAQNNEVEIRKVVKVGRPTVCRETGDREFCPFMCGICYKLFSEVHVYFCHFKEHNISQFVDTCLHVCLDKTSPDGSIQVYFCSLCNSSFQSPCSLHDHLVVVEHALRYTINTMTNIAENVVVKCSNSSSLAVSDCLSKDGNSMDVDQSSDRTVPNMLDDDIVLAADGNKSKFYACNKKQKSEQGTHSAGFDDKTEVIDTGNVCNTEDMQKIYDNECILAKHDMKIILTDKLFDGKRNSNEERSDDKIVQVVETDSPKHLEGNIIAINDEMDERGFAEADRVEEQWVVNKKVLRNHKRQFSQFKEDTAKELENDSYLHDPKEKRRLQMIKYMREYRERKRQKALGLWVPKEKIAKKKSKADMEQKVSCDVCGLLFKKKYLPRHKQSHSGTKDFECELCHKLFRTRSQLYGHKVHHRTERDHICTHCGKAFNNGPNLRQHIKTHVKERTLQCPICPKQFRSNYVLKDHIMRHSEEKPLNCPVCGRSFRKMNEVQRHLRVHSDDRPHHCDMCQRAFKSRSNLVKHQKTHDKGLSKRNKSVVRDGKKLSKRNMSVMPDDKGYSEQDSDTSVVRGISVMRDGQGLSEQDISIVRDDVGYSEPDTLVVRDISSVKDVTGLSTRDDTFIPTTANTVTSMHDDCIIIKNT